MVAKCDRICKKVLLHIDFFQVQSFITLFSLDLFVWIFRRGSQIIKDILKHEEAISVLWVSFYGTLFKLCGKGTILQIGHKSII